MCAMKTPGVYIVEKNAFPSSVVEVATAVPAFIGYTEKAKNGTKSLLNVPWKINSLAEYEQYFGGAPKPQFELKKGGQSDIGIKTLDASAEIQSIRAAKDVILNLRTDTDKAEAIARMAQNSTSPIETYTNLDQSLALANNIIKAIDVKTLQNNAKTKFDTAKKAVEAVPDSDKNKKDKLKPAKEAVDAAVVDVDKAATELAIDKAIAKVTDAKNAYEIDLEKDPIPDNYLDQLKKAAQYLSDAVYAINMAKVINAYNNAFDTKKVADEALKAAKPDGEGKIDPQKVAKALEETQKAVTTSKILANELVPMCAHIIESIAETARKKENITTYYNLERKDRYNLYYLLRFFFANGGGPCYIVSSGEGYKEDAFSPDALTAGIPPLVKEQEPTMLLIPEAVRLEAEECYNLQQTMLRHCGEMQNRIAVLDIHNGDKSRQDPEAGNIITAFREKIGTNFLNYAAAYYPWLNTSIVSDKDINISAIPDTSVLKQAIETEALFQSNGARIVQLLDLADKLSSKDASKQKEPLQLHKTLLKQSETYAVIIKEIVHQLNLLPPASAMAGIYTLVDQTKGVWKAPANVGLSHVISPAVNISHADQEDLNVPVDGKAVNAIRYFVGEGVKVWGARTLDGNSLDWRYINVRRTMIMLEESIKNASKAFVFEPNVINTWVNVRSMISNFLNDIWKRGGLAGAVPEDAFSVHVGLGDTMTPEDILEGIMRITVLVAISRPAEFIEITFQQQMQKS